MSVDIRYPNITANDQAGQLLQVKSYLHQLVEQLNWALKNVSVSESGYVAYGSSAGSGAMGSQSTSPLSTFNSIKGLIIKSADIINAYYDVISKRLDGLYVAESEFGVYKEQTSSNIKATSDSITQLYTNTQEITSKVGGLESSWIEVNAHINTGKLYYDENGVPVYGLEVGQRTEIDGVEVFNKYARFTSEKLSFYDQNNNEVAYVSDKKLYITHVEVTGSFKLGSFIDTIQPDGSIVTKWISGGDG